MANGAKKYYLANLPAATSLRTLAATEGFEHL